METEARSQVRVGKFPFRFGFLVMLIALCSCHIILSHGPSVRLHPDVHYEVGENTDCLACHHWDRSPEGPAISHPIVPGCLKCHNDEV